MFLRGGFCSKTEKKNIRELKDLEHKKAIEEGKRLREERLKREAREERIRNRSKNQKPFREEEQKKMGKNWAEEFIKSAPKPR